MKYDKLKKVFVNVLFLAEQVKFFNYFIPNAIQYKTFLSDHMA